MNKTAQANTELTWLPYVLIAASVLIAYSQVFSAGFLSWDDGEYVLHNNDIRAVNADNLRSWFSAYYVGNYHPLTMFSFAIDHMMGGLQPFVYHFTSILLHLCNAFLVFAFIKKLQSPVYLALVTALIFALHPMQTESVSWIAERKTVLSSLFYLLAMLQYITHVHAPTPRRLLLLVLAAAAAILSKGTAVALPLSLIAIDVWLGKSLVDRKLWIAKLPVFAMALIMGIVALKAQQSGKFLDTHATYSALHQGLFAGYAYIQYIVRFLVPVNLSAMYPYPESIGLIQYLFFSLAIGMIPFAVLAWRRKWNVLLGGILFYTANILFVLQFIAFGEALMADRYMYLSCIGIVYPAVFYSVGWLHQRSMHIHTKAVATVTAVSLIALTLHRNDAWLSDMNFFNAMLSTFPNSAVAQYSVGGMYMRNGDYARAELHFDKAVRLEPNNYKAWHNKGALHLRQGKAMEALEALDRSIAINGYPKAYFTRALLHQSTGSHAMALNDIEHVLAAQPQNARAWHLKGNCMEQQGDLQAALAAYSKAIEYSGAEPIFFVRRGLVFSKLKQHSNAAEDIEAAIKLSPDNGEAHYYLGIVKYQGGQSPCTDLRKAVQLGYRPAQATIEKLCR